MWFTAPEQVNHRRYEALRAYFVDGLTHAQAGQRFGYTRWAMVNLVREHRAGKLQLFAAARKPGPAPGVAPAKDRARARVIELRRRGLSTHEISTQSGVEGTPLNRTSVGEVLAEEGFGRLLRHPDPVASTCPATPGRDTHLPRTTKLDLAAWPQTVETGKAGGVAAPTRPGRHRPPEVGAPGRISRHPRRSRRVLVVVAAGVGTDAHQAGLPRR